MTSTLFRISLLTCLAGLPALAAQAQPAPAKPPQIIILKLDDITTNGAEPGSAMSPRWQRVIDFLAKSKLKASCGIIGYSLEQDNPTYFQWIKDLHDSGNVEFWNHGYRNRKAEDKAGEFEGSYQPQLDALQKTQRLAREKLGITLTTFGPHWSGTNQSTGKALDQIPELRIWFYGPPKTSSKLVLERVLTLENPTFVPDYDRFVQLYQQRAQDKPVLALQGHPNAWTPERWEGFVKIIRFLQDQGCTFMTPSEYLAQQQK